MRKRFGNFTDFNPYFGTDYGICSIIKPQLAFNSSLDNVPYWHKIFGRHNWAVTKGVEVSEKENGQQKKENPPHLFPDVPIGFIVMAAERRREKNPRCDFPMSGPR